MSERTVVLVEGESDRAALEVLARRSGRLVEVEVIGGAQAIRRVVAGYDDGPRLLGLCDLLERGDYLRALPPEAVFVCDADLEDELLRAVGVKRALSLVDAEGEGDAFQTLQKQAPWQGKPVGEQLRRFLGSKGGRKVRYGRLLAEAVDLDRAPAPLLGVLDATSG